MVTSDRLQLFSLPLPRGLGLVLLELDLRIIEPSQVLMILLDQVTRLLILHLLLVRVVEDHQVPHGHLRAILHSVPLLRLRLRKNCILLLDTGVAILGVELLRQDDLGAFHDVLAAVDFPESAQLLD